MSPLPFLFTIFSQSLYSIVDEGNSMPWKLHFSCFIVINPSKMIFIEQFQATWPLSILMLESWLSMSSSPEVPMSSILRIPSPRHFIPQLCETSSGVVAVGVFAAEACRELWDRPSRLHIIYVVHAYCCSVIGQHSDNWNLIGQFLYIASLLIRGFTLHIFNAGYQNLCIFKPSSFLRLFLCF